MPKVSVIIPAYNGDRFIAEAIESVFDQTYKDYEIIVVNDGSTDSTEQALKPYLQHIHYVAQPNQGVAAARNRGLAIAQGDFIAFLDQDDVFLPDKLALQIDRFEVQPQLGIVHSGWKLVDYQRSILSDIQPWHEAPKLDLAGWMLRMPVFLSAMLLRRTWLDKVGGLDSSFKQACDVDLVQRLALLGCQTAWVPQTLVEYRQHGYNDSRNTLIQATESWIVLDEFFARSDIPQEVRRIENQCRYYKLIWIAWRLYYTNHQTEAIYHLKKSLRYTPFTLTETILHWLKSFSTYSLEYGVTFDMHPLINTSEWQQLITQALE